MFTSKTVLDFVSSACEKSRSLVIINVNNLVHVEGNINQQAKLIQKYIKEKGRDIIAITIALANKKRTADIQVFYHDREEKEDGEKGEGICAVLNKINSVYLEIPVVICGYSQLTRSRSVWSPERAATHQVITRGEGIDIGQYCQAFARLFGGSKDILKKNGFDHMEALVTQHDWEMFQNCQVFIDEIFNWKEESNEPFRVLWNRKFSSLSNIFRSTNRHMSPNRMQASCGEARGLSRRSTARIVSSRGFSEHCSV
jgi:hypothetical protein